MGKVFRNSFIGLGAFFLSLALAGCSGFFTPRTGTPAATPKFAFVANFQAGTAGSITAFTIDSSTGALTNVGSFANATSSAHGPTALTTVSGKFLYSANDAGTVSGYTVNTTTGALTAVAGSPFPAGTNPNALVADPSGKFLYVANSASHDVNAYSIDASTGVLTAIGVAVPAGVDATNAGPAVGLAMHPSGNFLYVATDASGIAIFKIGASGVLTFVNTILPQSGGAPQSIAIEKTGNLAYAADGVNSVEEFSIETSTGALSLLGGSPVAAGTAPLVLTADSAGSHVYVADQTGGSVLSFGILTNGSLLPITGGSITAGSSPSSIAIEPSGKFVYVTNLNGSPDISIFTIDSAGKLVAASTANTGASSPTNAASIAFL